MKKLFILLALLPFISLAQRYEGERNKKGEPDGEGVIYFDNLSGGFTEKLEGTFKNGAPTKGKSFRYFKENGRIQMKFEGKFKLKQKGVFHKLSDLVATGKIAFYYYEENEFYNDRGYYVIWGDYDGKNIRNSCCVSGKKRQMCHNPNANWNNWTEKLTPEAMQYFKELFPSVGSACVFDRKPEFQRIHVARKHDSFIRLNNIRWSGPVKNGLLDGKGNGYLTTTSDDGGSLNYTFEGEFREGVPVMVTIHREYYWDKNGWINSREDKSTVRVSTGELRNNLRPFKIERLSGKSYWRQDTSYEGYVDENFNFKSDYAEEAKKDQIEKENAAWGSLFNAVGKVVGGTLTVMNELAPGSTNSNKGLEFDEKECKAPSGDLVKTDFFGQKLLYYHYEKNGVIKFRKYSWWIEYNVYIYSFDESKKHYQASTSSYEPYELGLGPVLVTEYKTYEEMETAIVNTLLKAEKQ